MEQTECSSRVSGFCDLPREVRDIVYRQLVHSNSPICIRQPSIRMHQPAISKVSRRLRNESLDIYYGKHSFELDMQGWLGNGYPMGRTPDDVFNSWITTVGDEIAARLRQVSFNANNFSVQFVVADMAPRISFKFATYLSTSFDVVAQTAPRGYNFEIATNRAKERVTYVVDGINTTRQLQPLTSDDLCTLCRCVSELRPALCTLYGDGWKATVLDEDPSIAPNGAWHEENCGVCNYNTNPSVLAKW